MESVAIILVRRDGPDGNAGGGEEGQVEIG